MLESRADRQPWTWVDRWNVIVPPPLFTEPADGWITWAFREAERRGSPSGPPPSSASIAGQLIINTAPAWAQGIALADALSGRLDTSEAQCVREAFRGGRPLSLLPYGSSEQYLSFFPILWHKGGGRYQAGYGKGSYTFQAEGDEQALQVGRRWYFRLRELEIKQLKHRAKKGAIRVSRPWLDIFEALLGHDGELTTQEGVTLVWQSGPHRMYIAIGRGYAYELETTTGMAVKLGLLGAASLKTRLRRSWAKEKLVRLIAPSGWEKIGDGHYCWQNGFLRDEVLVVGDKHLARVALRGDRITIRFRRTGKQNRRPIMEACKGLPDTVVLGWAARRVTRESARRRDVETGR